MVELERVAFGPLGLRGLEPGKSRRLTKAEVERLRRAAEPAAAARKSSIEGGPGEVVGIVRKTHDSDHRGSVLNAVVRRLPQSAAA